MSKEHLFIDEILNFEEVPCQEIQNIMVENAIQAEEPGLREYTEDDYFPDESKDLFSEMMSETVTTNVVPMEDSGSEGEIELLRRVSNRPHVNNRRKKRGEKSALQLAYQNGYWTKNFLQVGKNPHLKWIQKKVG